MAFFGVIELILEMLFPDELWLHCCFINEQIVYEEVGYAFGGDVRGILVAASPCIMGHL